MLEVERKEKIMHMLNQNRTMNIEETATLLNVSSMTIRRDLKKLMEQNDSIKRCHGGATLITDVSAETGFDGKRVLNVESKRHIAQVAFEMIPDNSFIYLDAGTTIYELSNLIKTSNLRVTIMTNDVAIANYLKDSHLPVLVTGGLMQSSTGCLLGSYAEEFIGRVRPDIAFMGATSIDEEYYVTTPTLEKATMKKRIVENSQKSYLLVDSSKFYKHSAYVIYNLREFNGVITDKEFTMNEKRNTSRSEINIINVG